MVFFLLLLATIRTATAETTPLKTRMITAAVLNDFPPLYTRDDAGNPAGFAIDILERVATDSGLTIRYLPVENWSKAMQAVRSGEADLIPGIGISPVRSAEFTFSEKIETIPVSYFVRTSNR
ncbi:MAG: transporter substrate-binding domain-containing protein, partial [Gammaproteobacteria bacterium]|nr:transporter substrate-binding domain-containing protein [Gammaproteobacteria bacterium]